MAMRMAVAVAMAIAMLGTPPGNHSPFISMIVLLYKGISRWHMTHEAHAGGGPHCRAFTHVHLHVRRAGMAPAHTPVRSPVGPHRSK